MKQEIEIIGSTDKGPPLDPDFENGIQTGWQIFLKMYHNIGFGSALKIGYPNFWGAVVPPDGPKF